jgi:sigma-B regulation protein RsbU (phosphoserine phosphatase)
MSEKKIGKVIAAVVVTCCVVLLGSNAKSDEGEVPGLTDEERVWLAEHPGIRLAPAPNYPPIEFFDSDGQYRGIGADYISLMESKLGIRFEIQRYETWNDVVEATERGEVDVWVEAVGTPERREYMLFSDPYLHVPSVIIVRKETPGDLTLPDLAGLRVAVTKGYASYDFIRARQPDIDLLEVPSIRNGLERVSFGSADALIASDAAASFYIASLGLTNLRIAGESGYVMRLSMASRKDWPILIGILQKAQESLSDDERGQIYSEWVELEGTGSSLFIDGRSLGLLVILLAVLLAWLFMSGRGTETSHDTKWSTLRRSWPILLTTGAAAALVIIAAVWSQRVLEERSHRDVHNAIQTVLDTTGQAVIAWFREREDEVQLWASVDSIRESVVQLVNADLADPAALSSARAQFRAVMEPLLVGKNYLGVSVMNLDGDILGTSKNFAAHPGQLASLEGPIQQRVEDPTRAADPESEASKTERLKSGSDFGATVLANSSHLAVSVPRISSSAIFQSILIGTVISDRQGMVLAILVLHIDPGEEFSAILQRGRIGLSGETYAINQLGQLISESRFEKALMRIGLIGEQGKSILNIEIRDPGVDLTKGISAQFARQQQQQQPFTLMAQNAVSGESGHELSGYSDYRGVPVVGTWLWNDVYELGIATEMDVAEAYEFFQSYRRQLWTGTTLAVFLILGLTLIFLRGRIQMAAANAELETAYGIIKSHSDRMEEELNVGRDIQMSMIPLTFPAYPEHDEFFVHATLQPAREVGGDFYDFFFTDEEHFCLCVGDVSGKGVPAALFMAVTKTLIKSRALDVLSTARIISHVNDELSDDNPSSMFVTIFIAIVNIRTGHITFTCAGHNPPYIKRSSGKLERLDNRHGPVIGAAPGLVYEEQKDRLNRGDFLILYTDGVTEAIDHDGRLFSEEKLVAVFNSMKMQSVEEITSETLDAVRDFERGTDQTDDITILAFQYRGEIACNNTESWQMTIHNQLSEIPRVIDGIDTFCQELPVALTPSRKLKIVLDEILNNIISYGYRDDLAHEVRVEVDPISDGIVIRITDDGIPFNPLDLDEPNTDLPADEREIGGLGVHLVKEMVEDASYERRDNLNILRLMLRFTNDDGSRAGESNQQNV